ncbi:ATP-grasp domain-containing protein [Alteromonas oceanisediminis]|uniref:ATP-grasp domain-containing protein n=1 Tax=Alteromonas oceanisediminis TaxID=2836180 RepID=UPI001BDB24D9|nr:hypothetical protein [Alteromonas oceanisediminis]MBT0587715.1 hypothetical protein [Alteromonas oceanisediminis]
MPKQCTVILGCQHEPEVQQVTQALQQQGRCVYHFDTREYPQRNPIDFRVENNIGSITLSEQRISFNRIGSVYWRTIYAPRPINDTNADTANSVCMLKTFLDTPTIHWVNPRAAIESHKIKPRQLYYAQYLGASIPATYVGSSLDTAIAFASQYEEVVAKPTHGGCHTIVLPQLGQRNEKLAQLLSSGPWTLQAYIDGENIRTFVIGDKVYSALIRSNSIDYRDDKLAVALAIPTPRAIQQLAKRIMRGFGMQWTAIDWRRTSDGRYFFLEANPSPMFVELERATGLPITEALAHLLCSTPNTRQGRYVTSLQNEPA